MHNLADKHPGKVKALVKAWFEEAEANNVLPLDDRTPAEVIGEERPSTEPQYRSPGEFRNGHIYFVGVTVEEQQYLDLEKLAAAGC
jgi:hypothetical protein